MNKDPPPGKFPVQKVACDGSNVSFTLLIFYLVLQIKKNFFEQLKVDKKTETQLEGLSQHALDTVQHSTVL